MRRLWYELSEACKVIWYLIRDWDDTDDPPESKSKTPPYTKLYYIKGDDYPWHS